VFNPVGAVGELLAGQLHPEFTRRRVDCRHDDRSRGAQPRAEGDIAVDCHLEARLLGRDAAGAGRLAGLLYRTVHIAHRSIQEILRDVDLRCARAAVVLDGEPIEREVARADAKAACPALDCCLCAQSDCTRNCGLTVDDRVFPEQVHLPRGARCDHTLGLLASPFEISDC